MSDKSPPCIFCNNESGSEEHLWAAWMHRRVKLGPVRAQKGTAPNIIDEDPEQTINTVCHTCNNTWMSRLEEKNIPAIGDMLDNKPTSIDRGRQRLLNEWAVKTAMIMDSIKPNIGNESFYTREERTSMRESGMIPAKTQIWIGALTEQHLGAFGTDFTIVGGDGKTRVGTGIANTIAVSHFVVQVVTTHILPKYGALQFPNPTPKSGDWENMLIGVYPKAVKTVEWPPKIYFTNGGPRGIAYLMDRWRPVGGKVGKITNEGAMLLDSGE
jgi:hypothetical protein